MKNAFADLRSKYPSLDQQIRHDNNFNSDGSRGIACEAEPITPWEYGNVVSDFLKNVSNMEGLSRIVTTLVHCGYGENLLRQNPSHQFSIVSSGMQIPFFV